MADYNFILSIAGLNTALNLNDNNTILLSETPDLANLFTRDVPANSQVQIIDPTPILSSFGFVIIQNIDDNYDVDIAIADSSAPTVYAYRRLSPKEFMFISSPNVDVSTTDVAFVSFNNMDVISARGVGHDAKIKVIHIR